MLYIIVITEYAEFEAKIDQLRKDMMGGGALAYGAPRRDLFVRCDFFVGIFSYSFQRPFKNFSSVRS